MRNVVQSLFIHRVSAWVAAAMLTAALGPQARGLTTPPAQSIPLNNTLNVGGAPGGFTPGSGLSLDGQNITADSGGSRVLTNLSSNALGMNGAVNYTAAAWINPNNTGGDKMVFGQESGNALHLGIRGGNMHYGHWGNDSTGAAVATGVWQHVAYVYNGGNQQMYLNGALVANNTVGALNNGNNVSIGRSRNNGAFNGILDDVVIYNQALSGAQIGSLFGGTNPTSIATPTLYYNFEETGGTTVGNSGSTGTAGTLNNSQPINLTAPNVASNWAVQGFNIIPGGGSSDNDLNGHAEALHFWNTFDRQGAQLVGTHTIGGEIYNIENNVSDTTDVVDFAGSLQTNGGNFGTNHSPSFVGGVTAFDVAGADSIDYSLRAMAEVQLAPGVYTIAVGSDDGRYLGIDGDARILAVGGQGGTEQFTPREVIFRNPTGHNQSLVVIETSGGSFGLETMFSERGGGDSFEVSIAAGDQTTAGFNTTTFQLMAPGALGGAVQSLTPGDPIAGPGFRGAKTTHQLNPQPGFTLRAFNLIDAGGSTDSDLNSIQETSLIWQHLDPRPGFTGAFVEPNTGATYFVANHHSGAMIDVVDFHPGNGGDFAVNHQYSDPMNADPTAPNFGTGLGGDDFSVRAHAFVGIPAGTWTVSLASDDGRVGQILGVNITGTGDQQDIFPGAGPDIWGFNGNTGHDRSLATFTITEADLNLGDFFVTELDAFFYERGGGDSFEISIAPGTLTDFGQDGGDNFRLLEDGTFGWIVSKTPITEVPEPGTMGLALMALGALGLRVRRRRAA